MIPCLCCVSAVLKAVSNVNDIIAPALVGKVSGLFSIFKQMLNGKLCFDFQVFFIRWFPGKALEITGIIFFMG